MNNIVPVKVGYDIGRIMNNLDEVAASVREYCESYRGVVVTEETVADGKKMLASIRKEKKLLDDTRKQIKNAWNEPYKEFEKKCKEVLSLYDEPIKLIDAQVQDLEEQRKEAKRAEIKLVYESTPVPEEIKGWLSLEDIYDPKWENATFKMKDIVSAIEEAYEGLLLQYKTIKMMQHPFEAEGIGTLQATLSTEKAIETMQKLKEQDEAIKRMVEEEKKKMEAQVEELSTADIESDQVEFNDIPFNDTKAFEDIPFDGFDLPDKCQPIFEVTVTCDADRMMDLKLYLDGLGYYYTTKEV